MVQWGRLHQVGSHFLQRHLLPGALGLKMRSHLWGSNVADFDLCPRYDCCLLERQDSANDKLLPWRKLSCHRWDTGRGGKAVWGRRVAEVTHRLCLLEYWMATTSPCTSALCSATMVSKKSAPFWCWNSSQRLTDKSFTVLVFVSTCFWYLPSRNNDHQLSLVEMTDIFILILQFISDPLCIETLTEGLERLGEPRAQVPVPWTNPPNTAQVKILQILTILPRKLHQGRQGMNTCRFCTG